MAWSTRSIDRSIDRQWTPSSKESVLPCGCSTTTLIVLWRDVMRRDESIKVTDSCTCMHEQNRFHPPPTIDAVSCCLIVRPKTLFQNDVHQKDDDVCLSVCVCACVRARAFVSTKIGIYPKSVSNRNIPPTKNRHKKIADCFVCVFASLKVQKSSIRLCFFYCDAWCTK